MTKELQEKQKAAGIREGKTLNVAVNSRTRSLSVWNLLESACSRNTKLCYFHVFRTCNEASGKYTVAKPQG